MIKQIGGKLGPLSCSFFPKVTSSNFQIAILFSVVEKFNNYVLEDDLIHHGPRGRAASYELCPLFIYSIGYWEIYKSFQGDFFLMGGGVGLRGWIFSWGKRIFMKEVLDFPALFENNHKLNKKKQNKCFHLKARSYITT